MISFYGGVFATLPAYLADIFGTKFVGAIHGRVLTAWSLAGVLGPKILTSLREQSVYQAISDLASKIDSDKFQQAFGADKSALDALVEAKTVTIIRLMDICPPGTIDPTPFLYDSTVYAYAGMLSVALVSNALIRPVSSKFHLPK